MFFRNSSPFQGQQQTLRLHLPQTHLPPQPATSHTDDTTHTPTRPPRPGADLICRVQPESSAVHLSFVRVTSLAGQELCSANQVRGGFCPLEVEEAAARGTGVPERRASSRALLKSTGINAGSIFHVPPAERRSPGRQNICLPFMRFAVIPRNSLC